MRKSTKILLGILFVFNLFIVYGFIVTVWPHQVIRSIETPFPVEKTEYGREDTVVYQIKGCTGDHRYPFYSSRSLVSKDGRERYFLFGFDGIQPEGCFDYTDRRTIIPPIVLPGEYSVISTVNFYVSPLKTVTIDFPTEYFTVRE